MPQPRAVVPPRVPQPDSDAAIARESEVRRITAQNSGTAANVVSDLRPSDIAAMRPVLRPANAVYLGQ